MESWIEKIGNLWKIVLVLSFTFLVFYFRKEVKIILVERILRVKKGDTEVTIEPGSKETLIQPSSKAEIEIPTETGFSLKEIERSEEVKLTTPEEYRTRMIDAFLESKSIEQVEKIYLDLQSIESDSISKLNNELLFLHISYLCGDSSAVEKIRKLSKNKEIYHLAHFRLALCYEEAGYFDKAAESYKISSEGRNNEIEKVRDLVSASICLFKDGQQEDSYLLIGREINNVTNNDSLVELYIGLSKLFDLANEYEFKAITLEKALEFRPNDTDILFQIGYAYSQSKFLHPLSLLHYKNLLNFDPNQNSALNNIGVEYEKLNMPIKAVNSYKDSYNHNNTLAAANLAFKYLYLGFSEEALKILDEAKSKKSPHENISKALSSFYDSEKAENKTEENTIISAREMQKFFISFSEGYFSVKSESPMIEGVWISPEGYEVAITKNNKQIEAIWVHENKKHKFDGFLSNRAVKIKNYKMSYGFIKNDELGFVEDGNGYIYLSKDMKKIFILNIKENEHYFQTLSRKS